MRALLAQTEPATTVGLGEVFIALLALLYIAVFVFLVVLAVRFVRAVERIADAQQRRAEGVPRSP